MRFGDSIRQMRADVGITQNELADRASVSLGFIQSLEQGARHGVSLEVAFRLAHALDVPIDRLAFIADVSRRCRDSK